MDDVHSITPDPLAPTTMSSDRRYYVYVVALSPDVRRDRRFRERNPHSDRRRPCLYVGSSAHPPEHRFEQHLNGYKSNRYVRKYGLELLPRIYDRYNPIESRGEAEQTEVHLAERLRRQGYSVWYG